MRLLESSIERKVVKWCKTHRILTTKLNGLGQRGKPDRVFWLPKGRAVLAEFKRPGERATNLQAYMIQSYVDLGFDVHIFHTSEQAIATLHRYLYETLDRLEVVG